MNSQKEKSIALMESTYISSLIEYMDFPDIAKCIISEFDVDEHYSNYEWLFLNDLSVYH